MQTVHADTLLPPLERPASLLDGGDAPDHDRLATEEAVVELYEWLSLVRLGSPRVAAADRVDPYLSRYQVPAPAADDSRPPLPPPPAGDVCTLRWRGFFSPTWACQTLLDALTVPSAAPQRAWLGFSASGFAAAKGLAGTSAECTFFRPADAPREYLLWDVRAPE